MAAYRLGDKMGEFIQIGGQCQQGTRIKMPAPGHGQPHAKKQYAEARVAVEVTVLLARRAVLARDLAREALLVVVAGPKAVQNPCPVLPESEYRPPVHWVFFARQS